MLTYLRSLDDLLRGRATRTEALQDGQLKFQARGLVLLILGLCLIYGLCMGAFALFKPQGTSVAQFLASTVKVPMLFSLTFLVTFPSLYVFNTLVGSRLDIESVFRLLVAGLAVTTTVLASFGPITVFFSLSTTSYPFAVLLNVVFFAISGLLGMKFLLLTLQRLTTALAALERRPLASVEPVPDSSSTPAATPPALPGALDSSGAFDGNVRTVFRVWVIIFSLVGAQMAWVLRPFIGNPNQAFSFFRPRQSDFFHAVAHQLSMFLFGN